MICCTTLFENSEFVLNRINFLDRGGKFFANFKCSQSFGQNVLMRLIVL